VVIKADMTSTAEAKRAVQETIKQLGGLDIILANAVSVFESIWDFGGEVLKSL
jgi:NAD(P)-dependent dehydrogenase (short-subunit alcohol dehydrogenase family)